MNQIKRSLQSRRRILLCVLALAATIGLGPAQLNTQMSKPTVEVWKSPTCGCCKDWIKHLEANGFQVKAYDKGNTAMRRELGMPEKFGSCHTAKINGYVIEGHVPAKEIHRLIKEKPKALGLAVPDMPIGTPGMDGPEYGGQVDPYDVLLVQRNGGATVYQAYTTQRPGKR